MSSKIGKTLALGVMFTVASSVVRADNLIQGVFYENGEAVDVQPFSPAELQEIANGVTALGGNGAGFLAATTSGNLTVGLLAPQPGIAGAHDSDTIGVNASNMEAVDAIVKHEWQHVQNAQAAGTSHDMGMKSSLSNPCGSANHALLTAESANDVCSLCTADMTPDEKDALRALFEDFTERAQNLMDEATFFGCPPVATPPASTLIPPCECLA